MYSRFDRQLKYRRVIPIAQCTVVFHRITIQPIKIPLYSYMEYLPTHRKLLVLQKCKAKAVSSQTSSITIKIKVDTVGNEGKSNTTLLKIKSHF